VRFLVDAQLPPLLCQFFVERGHDASHVFEFFEHDAADAIIFEHARTISAVVVTKDEDFAARSDVTELGASPQILWLRIGNCRNRALLATIARAWPDIQAALVRGERIVELRGD
jgi:predicted nuclease of predicted toxin-antitoxin system